jgi:saccharopine dehydrogenase-like NADP-dependent oxidoreductase
MKKIVVLGAGRSSPYLIDYLLENAAFHGWTVTVGDVSLEQARQRVKGAPEGKAVAFDVNSQSQREQIVRENDIVVSLLPPSMHILIARECLRFGRHMVTASYVSKEIRALESDAKALGITMMNEAGLDPGIDHISAMKIIDEIKSRNGHLISFKSYCGGLISPESDDNPWGYKFTWNPRNVVLAGQGTALYMERGKHRYIPYSRLFKETERVEVKNFGSFEGYANRDSLSYREPYGLEGIETMLRGTLRMPGFCEGWHAFVSLGITDDSYTVDDSENITYRDFIESYLGRYTSGRSTEEALAAFMNIDKDSDIIKRIEWLGLFEDKKINLKKATPAMILQNLLEEKWKLSEEDKDMIVMQHQFEYIEGGVRKRITSSLVVKGEDKNYTAMAKTVGLPSAIIAKLLATGRITRRGVLIPTFPEVYRPVLEELEDYDIIFGEEETEVR